MVTVFAGNSWMQHSRGSKPALMSETAVRAHLQARILQSLFRIEAPKELLDERPNGSGAEQIGDFLFDMDESSFDEEEPRELQHSCLETEAAGRLFDR